MGEDKKGQDKSEAGCGRAIQNSFGSSFKE
jgi:hypothetical protein